MTYAYIDIEANGLYREASEIHMVYVYVNGEMLLRMSPEGLHRTLKGCVLVGHNIVGFDLPVLEKLWGFKWTGEVYDTFLASQLAYPDFKLFGRHTFPGLVTDNKLKLSHSLKAWGYRLRDHKGDYEGPWEDPSPEELEAMAEYCKQDVLLTAKVHQWLMDSNRISQQSLELEQKVKKIIWQQEQTGVLFDTEKAFKLYQRLSSRRRELDEQLKELFGPVFKPNGKPFVPKRDNSKMRYKAGCACQKVVWEDFNPSSRQHIAYWFRKKYNWKPSLRTENGAPKVDEAVLKSLEYPEAKLLAESLMLDKRIGQLMDGKNSWLNTVEPDGRIRGQVRTLGCVTGRMSHNKPNLAQVPAVYAPYGKECRELFTVPRGYKLVGADASGLELRCLAHYTYPFDEGEYAKQILEGDIHSFNQQLAGLPTRASSKTAIYALIYGCGDARLGEAAGKGAKEGREIRRRLAGDSSGLGRLQQAITAKVASSGALRGADKRLLPIRSDHSALNTLLQSAGAVIMKLALVCCDELFRSEDIEAKFVVNCHDEFQCEVREDQAERAGQLMVKSMNMAGDTLGWRIRIDREYKVGRNWAETH